MFQAVSKTTMTAKDKTLIASFLVFGTLNTVAVTMLLARKSEGRDGTLRYFDHSYILTLLTFLGKAVCMIPYLIKRASDREERLVDEEAVMVLSQLIHELRPDEPGHLLKPLLHLICETYPGGPVEVICSCSADPHIMKIPPCTFLLLEAVENSLGVGTN